MKMTEGIYDAGYAARMCGVSLNANPYLHTGYVETWEQGWAAVHYKLLSDKTRKEQDGNGNQGRG